MSAPALNAAVALPQPRERGTPAAASDHWRRPGPTAPQRRADLAIGLGVAALAVLNVVLARSAGIFASANPPSLAEQTCWALAVTLPLIWRRTSPEIVSIVVAVAFIAEQYRGVQEQQVASGAIFAAIYALGAWGRDRSRARWLRLGIIAAMFVWLAVAWLMAHDELPADGMPGASGELPPLLASIINGVLINGLFFGFAYLFGETAWQAARRRHQLEEQAAQLRAAQALISEQAVLGERVRIARELHDVVAHHVSVMGIQASASRRAMDRNPELARTALSAIEQCSRTAVDELRRMLGALRAADRPGDGEGLPHQRSVDNPAGIERVEELVDRARAAGLEGRLGVHGTPRTVPESVSQAAYRIVQEAVTNTLKHANATMIDVRIRYLVHDLELDIADDGRGDASGTASGLGLIGMRERVAVHDGNLETGTRIGGGFRVRARLPIAPDTETSAVPGTNTTGEPS
ncbi:sensor histidine kinase [Couchioplanes caeruleus]|uniref:histidine kinase n=2 Tax=Couchioplanes caeruleus TaxID=56438 RepID=A0A1K0FCC1_9ACTN|nr:sensor histidine kinase [Couchioplanes caeruleus]OJF10477.1 two-component sensor histidine kinase [Couchioplanes caeruleus subsp. caeruleus]ROP32557.1 signal transduction histidine kinase [Couchioplanes caeruleus]